MAKLVTDHRLLAQLNGTPQRVEGVRSSAKGASILDSLPDESNVSRPVTDPALLAELNAGEDKPANRGILSEIPRGVVRGIDNLGSMGGGAIKWVGDVTGSETISDAGESVRKLYSERAGRDEVKAAVPSYKDVENVGDAAQYLAGGFGEMVPMMLPSVGGAAVGAKLLTRGAIAGIERKVGKKAAIELLKTAGSAEAKAVARAATKGTLAGAGAASYGMELGSIYGDQAEQGIEKPGKAALYAVPAAALDVVGQLPFLAKIPLFKTLQESPLLKTSEAKNWFVRGAKEAFKGAGAEGVTEFIQTIIERGGADKSMTSKEALEEGLNAGIIGGFSGGVMSGAGGALSRPQPAIDHGKDTVDLTTGQPVDTASAINPQPAETLTVPDITTEPGTVASVLEALKNPTPTNSPAPIEAAPVDTVEPEPVPVDTVTSPAIEATPEEAVNGVTFAEQEPASAPLVTPLDVKANGAASSPNNDTTEPTPGQIEGGDAKPAESATTLAPERPLIKDQIWGKSRDEYVTGKTDYEKRMQERAHFNTVAKALTNGMPVPQQAVKDYPELLEKWEYQGKGKWQYKPAQQSTTTAAPKPSVPNKLEAANNIPALKRLEKQAATKGVWAKGGNVIQLHSPEAYAEFFKPGRIMDSYLGTDKVLSFDDNNGQWMVEVQEVGKDGKAIGDPRKHSTAPSTDELAHIFSQEGWTLHKNKTEAKQAANLEELKQKAKKAADRPSAETVTVPSTEATPVIATFNDEEHGIEARVAKIDKGYSLTIKDTDSGDVLPTANIYPTEAEAIAKAKKVARIAEAVAAPASQSEVNMDDFDPEFAAIVSEMDAEDAAAAQPPAPKTLKEQQETNVAKLKEKEKGKTPQGRTIERTIDRIDPPPTSQQGPTSGPALHSNPMFDPKLIVSELSKLTRNIQAALPKLVELGREVYGKGYKTLDGFTSRMKELLGELYETFKGQMVEVFQDVKRILSNEKGAVGRDINREHTPNAEADKALKGDFLEKLYGMAEQALDSKAERGSKAAQVIQQAKEWAKTAAEYMSPLGHLQNKEAFLSSRYKALGSLDEINSAVKEIYRVLSMANATEDMPALYDYFTTEGADVNTIKHPEVRRTAKAVKGQIVVIGDMLVEKGWLKPEKHEETAGSYLPRVYLKHILGPATFAKWAGGKKLDGGYLKQRQDIPEEVRRIVLGEVTDAAYLAARAVSLPLRDLAVSEWLESIASDTENGWVLPKSLVTWKYPEGSKGKRVTPFWLKAEAARLREQARHMAESDAQEARALADRMEDEADTSLFEAGLDPDRPDEVPKGYKKLPNTARYGALRGMVVRQEIHNDIVGVGDIKLGESEVIRSLFGATVKATALWKWAKVAANPPAQVRNLVSNMVLLHLSGVPFVRVPQRIVQAIIEIKNNGTHWQVAKQYGVRGSTFANVEMGRAGDSLLALSRKNPNEISWMEVARLVGVWGKKIFYEAPGDAYQFLEAVGKTAKIIDMMEREGASAENAALAAHEALFDYSLVPPTVRWARMSPIGAPFITFAYKSFPRLLEVAATRPWRFAPYLTLMAALPALVGSMTGLDDDDMDRLKKALPEWLQEKGHAFFLPYKDAIGRWQVIDLGYFLPWTPFTELAGELGKGEIGKAAQTLSLFGGPVISMIQAIKTGDDPFTGQKIVSEANPTPGEQVSGWLAYMYQLGAPTWLTDQGFAGKLRDAYSEKADRFGDPKTTPAQAWSRIAGVNIYSADPARTRVQNLERMNSEIAALKRGLATKMKGHPKMSAPDRLELLRKHESKVRDVIKRRQEYAGATAITFDEDDED